MDKLSALRAHFGYASFREGQERLIDAVLAGRDAFGVMPTGGGKSLCYQIPAVLFPGVTVVISPLISLMRDQVLALKEADIPAAYVNSTLSPEEMRAVFANARKGRYKLLYVAPERLEAESFLQVAREIPLDFVAVDEAHCISQWGQDFRPSYLKISGFINALPRRPVVAAFTATATEAVRRDVVRILNLRDPLCVVTGFDRPNLCFRVLTGDKKRTLLGLLSSRRGQSGIIYCATRKLVESVCRDLTDQGLPATRYHAGLPEEERSRNQEEFVYDRKPVMVATNAFGMGIDKSNVRYVIHYNMPQSLEAYYQEAGRAGRDGEPADCILLYAGSDVATARFLIENSEENRELSPEERARVIQQNLRRLQFMVGYCQTGHCLRGYILEYFGESHPPRCENCSNCLSKRERVDITREAQMIFSCVKRIEQKLNYSVGASLVLLTLRGSGDRRVRELGLDQLSTYGIMKEVPRASLQSMVDALGQEGYLVTEPIHRTLRLTEKAMGVLFHRQPVVLALRQEDLTHSDKKKKPRGKPSPGDPGVFEALRALRREIAEREHVAPYMVFSDATLRYMAEKRPRTPEDFLRVSGVGEYKLRKYGKAFLEKLSQL